MQTLRIGLELRLRSERRRRHDHDVESAKALRGVGQRAREGLWILEVASDVRGAGSAPTRQVGDAPLKFGDVTAEQTDSVATCGAQSRQRPTHPTRGSQDRDPSHSYHPNNRTD